MSARRRNLRERRRSRTLALAPAGAEFSGLETGIGNDVCSVRLHFRCAPSRYDETARHHDRAIRRTDYVRGCGRPGANCLPVRGSKPRSRASDDEVGETYGGYQRRQIRRHGCRHCVGESRPKAALHDGMHFGAEKAFDGEARAVDVEQRSIRERMRDAEPCGPQGGDYRALLLQRGSEVIVELRVR